MKTEIGKYLAVSSILALLVACAPMSPLTSAEDTENHSLIQDSGSNIDHITLAKRHENLAKEMQAKVEEQENILQNKSRSSYFGKNGRKIKSHVAFKIREYKQAVQENLEKAAFYRKLAAEKSDRGSAAKVHQDNDRKKIKL
ncbi:MAG: hypothetical protein H0V39_02345 [Nitrosomonas sp.]|nr:hypothetical protein [Nitrosomonas sp.]